MARIKIKALPKFQGLGNSTVGGPQVSANYPIIPIPRFEIRESDIMAPPPEQEDVDADASAKKAEQARLDMIMRDIASERKQDPFDVAFGNKYNTDLSFQETYDKSLRKGVMKAGSAQDKKAYRSFFNKKWGSPFMDNLNNTAGKIEKANAIFQNTLGTAATVANYFNTQKQDKDFQKRMQRMSMPEFNMTVDSPEDRFGDYTQFGQFNPRYTGFKSKGTMTNPQYPQVRYAQDGLNLVPGDQIVQQSFLPDIPIPVMPVSAPTANVPERVTGRAAANASDVPIDVDAMLDAIKFTESGSKKGETKPGLETKLVGPTGLKASASGTYGMTTPTLKGIYRSSNFKNTYSNFEQFDNAVKNNPNIEREAAKTLLEQHIDKYGIYAIGAWYYPEYARKAAQGDLSVINKIPRADYGNRLTWGEDFQRKFKKYAEYAGLPYKTFDFGAPAPDSGSSDFLANASNLADKFNFTVTSTTGDQHNPGSKHYSGNAIDVRTRDKSPEEIEQFIAAAEQNGFKVLDERSHPAGQKVWSGPHLHIEKKQVGGENIKTMKVRITGTPSMKFGGQSDYGLDMGYQHLYNHMSENPYEEPIQSVSEKEETPEDPHVLEAEGGETIMKPTGEMLNITGDRHSEGGVKMTDKQAPTGSFLFSDTAKLKIGGAQLVPFGKSPNGKKFTPAALSKQYPTIPWMQKLKDPFADNYARRTADLMLQNNKKKLAELAMVQESMKGFPNGIPEIAKPYVGGGEEGQGQQMAQAQMGGMMMGDREIPKFQNAGEKEFDLGNKKVKARKVNAPELNPNVYSPYPNVSGLYWRQGQQGVYSPGYTVQGRGRGSVTVEDILSNPTKYRTFHQNMAGAPDDEKRKAAELLYKTGQMPGKWSPGTPDDFVYTELNPGTVPGTTTTTGGGTTGTTPGTTGTKDQPSTKSQNPLIPNTYNPTTSKIPYGRSLVDWRNIANAALAAATIKKYHGYLGQARPDLPIPIAEDPSGIAQQISGQYLNTANQIAQGVAPQGLTANLSNLSGQAMEKQAAARGEIGNRNAQRFTAASSERAGIKNQFALQDLLNRMKFQDEENVYDDRYLAGFRGAAKGLTAAKNQADINAATTYNMNISESPYFYVNPFNQRIRFYDENARAAYYAQLRGGSGSSGYDPDSYAKLHKQIYSQLGHISDPKERADAADRYMAMYYGGKSVATQYPYNSSKNMMRTTMPYGYGASYNNPLDNIEP